MRMTKNNIVNWINKRVVSYRVSWDDIADYLDMAIDEINSYMSTKYPHVTAVLDEFAPEDKTYSFRASGTEIPFFPEKYFTSIVLPYAITQILTTDEEFTMIYSKYMSQYQESLFIMARDEMNNIPQQFIMAPKGVYFANPDPHFKENPERYFNEKIIMDVPKIRVTYSWGRFKDFIPSNVQTFVEKPLPIDPNAYEIGFKYMPVMMHGEGFSTFIVDENKRVLGVFLGWSLKDDNNAGEIINGLIQLNEDVTFYAVFDLDIVSFVYEGNGGTVHNWRPLYKTLSEVSGQKIYPMGGTASRRGYRFIGFSPNEVDYDEFIAQNEVSGESGFSEDELGIINDTEAEPSITFTAQWYRLVYNITFVGHKEGTMDYSGRKTQYMFGDEFDLDVPVPTESNPDEFIGWWDNPSFLGDPVTKIYESDYGDKTFYAKYNEDKFRIRFLKENGDVISETFYTKGSIPASPSAQTKEDAPDEESGLWFSFTFDGFKNEQGESPSIVVKNEDYIENFIKKPKYKTIEIEYNTDALTTDTLSFLIQKGDITGFTELFNKLKSEDKESYVDGPDTYIVNKFISGEIEYGMDEEEIQILDNITFSCEYTEVLVTMTVYKKEAGMTVNGTPIATISFPTGVSASTVEITAASLTGIVGELDGSYLQGFNEYDTGTEEETPLPSTIDENLNIVSYYGEEINPTFIKKITIFDYPSKTVIDGTITKEFFHKVGTTVNLTNLITETEGTSFLYQEIEDLYTDSEKENSAGASIVLSMDTILYAGNISKKVLEIVANFKSPIGTPATAIVKTLYPKDSPYPDLSVSNLTSPFYFLNAPAGKWRDGWSLTEGGTKLETITTATQTTAIGDTGRLDIHWKNNDLHDFVIIYKFETYDSSELLSCFSLNPDDKARPYDVFKHTFNYTHMGNVETLYTSYESFINALRDASLDYFTTTFHQTKQQSGYSFHSYRDPLNSDWINSFPLNVSLYYSENDIKYQDKEIEIIIRLVRNSSKFLRFRMSSFPNPSQPLSEHSTNFGDLVYDEEVFSNKIFVPYSISFDFVQLQSLNYIPTLNSGRTYALIGSPIYDRDIALYFEG